MSSAFWADNSSIKATSEGTEIMLHSAWHCLTQSCLNSNMISPNNDTLSVGFTWIKFLAIPTDIVPDALACFPLCMAAKLLSFLAQWSWYDGRPPLPQLSGVRSAWEYGWWSNSDSFHKQAGPTSPGFSDSYKTAEEQTCLNALIQIQRGWKVLGSTLCWQGSHMERASCLVFCIQLLDPTVPEEESTSWTCTNKPCHTVISSEFSYQVTMVQSKIYKLQMYNCSKWLVLTSNNGIKPMCPNVQFSPQHSLFGLS